MAELIPPDALNQVLATVYSGVAKATQSPQPGLTTAPPAAIGPSAAQQAAVAAGTAGLAALPGVAAGVGVGAAGAVLAPAVAAGLARALAMLSALPLRVAALAAVLRILYGSAYLAGASEGAASVGGQMPIWTATIPDAGDHETWSPRRAKNAVDVAQGGLADVLGQLGIWIKEMSTTQVNRVGEAIREAVENGRPMSEARAAIDAIVHDATRARLIAETEYSRAQGLAQMETYRANGVPMLQWLAQPDACPLCLENEAASPQPTAHPQWPNGGIPVHPHERCAVAPYYPPRPR